MGWWSPGGSHGLLDLRLQIGDDGLLFRRKAVVLVSFSWPVHQQLAFRDELLAIDAPPVLLAGAVISVTVAAASTGDVSTTFVRSLWQVVFPDGVVCP